MAVYPRKSSFTAQEIKTELESNSLIESLSTAQFLELVNSAQTRINTLRNGLRKNTYLITTDALTGIGSGGGGTLDPTSDLQAKRLGLGKAPDPNYSLVTESSIAITGNISATGNLIGVGLNLSGNANVGGALAVTGNFSGSNISLSGNITGVNAKFSKAAFGGAEPTNEYNILAPGNSRFGTATFDGPVTFLGTVTEAEEREFTTSERYFTINNNEAGSGITGGSAGMYVKRGSQPNFEVGFYEDTQTYRIGLLGDLQAVATRQDLPISNGLPYWNNTFKRFDTITGLTYTSGQLNTPGKIKAGGDISTGAFSFKINDVTNPLEAAAVNLGLIVRGETDHSLLFSEMTEGVYAFRLSDHLNFVSTKGIYQNGVVRLDGSGNANLANVVSTTGNFNVAGSTNMSLNTGGDIILNPSGNDILPSTKYAKNLGSLQYKFLTLHAAELWVQTLVAQETIASVGGRIIIPVSTSVLIADLAASSTALKVKHNSFINGDTLWLEGSGKFEMIRISSSYTAIAGGYQYTVVRNTDGTGANDWYAGDAVVNTGQTGDGMIDIYSLRSIKSVLGGNYNQKGPAIVGNIRNSSTYNDWTEYWAIGNLEGIYGYGSKTMGIALGKYIPATGQPTQNGSYWTIDSTNGIRLNLVKAGAHKVGIQADNNGNLTFPGLDVGSIQGADWNTNLTSIPAILGVPNGKGLFLSSEYFGYYDTGTWKSAFRNDGSGLLANGNISWTTAGALTVQGYLYATTGGFGGTLAFPAVRANSSGLGVYNSGTSSGLVANSIRIGYITGGAPSAIKLTNTGTNSTSGLFGYTSAGVESFALRLDGTSSIAGWSFTGSSFTSPTVTRDNKSNYASIDASSNGAIGFHIHLNTNVPVGEGRKYLSMGSISKTSIPFFEGVPQYQYGFGFYIEDTPIMLLTDSVQRIGGFNLTAGEFTAIDPSSAITGGILRTAASGKRVELNGAENELRFYSDATRFVRMSADSAYVYSNISFYDKDNAPMLGIATGSELVQSPLAVATSFKFVRIPGLGVATLELYATEAGKINITAMDGGNSAIFMSNKKVLGERKTGWTINSATANRNLTSSADINAIRNALMTLIFDLGNHHGLIGT